MPLVSNQVRTRASKKADILALDHMGNSVIIELKRKNSPLGVETQALQYLADFSKFKGQEFIKRFSSDSPGLEESIYGFLGDEVKTEDINKNSRIILLARSFDPTLFSMGEWLSGRGIAFRCIEYTPHFAVRSGSPDTSGTISAMPLTSGGATWFRPDR